MLTVSAVLAPDQGDGRIDTSQWMLLCSLGVLCVWASGFSCKSSLSAPKEQFLIILDLKHKYWYMHVPTYGFLATPIELYTPRDLAFARILNVFVTSETTLALA